ncbi:hypothetical protein [Cypionkella sp. TWP1-2-1b2]|uniref:hypothetical protein n=1 Tax=Cypionkella sp. TWP1-2-1b2 TaxID=2804675 RepID=UPI003CED7FB4
MRDDIQGGVLATLIAALVMIVCCAGGGVALTAITGAVGRWIGGGGGVAIMSVAAVAALTWRSLRRARSSCGAPDANSDARRIE